MGLKKVFSKDGFVSQLFNFGLGPIIGMCISLVTVPITTRLLAPEEYGKSSLFNLVITLFDIVVLLGYDQAYVRFYNQKDITKKKLLSTCLFIPVLFSAIVLLFIAIFNHWFSNLLFKSYEPTIVFLMLLYLPAVLLNRFASLSIRMELRGKTYSFINVFQQVLNFGILILFLLKYERSFRAIIYSTIFSNLITCILSLFVSKQFFPISKFEVDKPLLKEATKYCLPLVPTSIMAWMMESFDKVALRMWSDFDELGLYSAAMKIVTLFAILKNIFQTTWTPMAYKWYEENEPQEKYEDIGSILLCFMTLIFACVVVFRNIVMLFLGEAYRGASEILVFLFFSPVFMMLSSVTGQGVGFAKKTIYNVYVWIISSAVNLLGNFILVPKFGALGAAISTGFSYIIFFFAATYYSRRVWVKFDLTKYYINIALLVLLGINILFFKSKVFEVILFVIILVYNVFILLKINKRRKFI